MNNLDFGVIVTIIGMATAFVTLLFLGLVIQILKKLFPVPQQVPKKESVRLARTGES